MAILYPASLANLVVEVGTRHCHQTLLLIHALIWANLCQWKGPVISISHGADSQGETNYQAIHYDDVIMGTMASQITSLTSVYWTVYSDAGQRKHQSSASLAFVRGIHRGQVNSPHKWPVTRKLFPFDDVIILCPLKRPQIPSAFTVLIHKARQTTKLSIYLTCLKFSGYQLCYTFVSITSSRWKGLTKSRSTSSFKKTLQWHPNERHGVSNHQHLGCLHSPLFRRTS